MGRLDYLAVEFVVSIKAKAKQENQMSLLSLSHCLCKASMQEKEAIVDLMEEWKRRCFKSLESLWE